MTNEMPQTTISSRDVDAMAAKLEAFAQSLPEQERNVLGWILTRAQAAEEVDTQGYALGLVQTPLNTQLARSAGLSAASGTTSVTWAYKFAN
jgi:hypothetical protein